MSQKKLPRIIVLDGATMNPGDLSWGPLQQLGDVDIHERTPPKFVRRRADGAEILLVNKVVLNESLIRDLKGVHLIVVTATGYDTIDIEAARQRGILVCNATGYSTSSVAQHVFALLLEISNRVSLHDRSVKERDWARQTDFSYTSVPVFELAGKTLGIYGLGRIGQRVARIAQAFGMQVIATHKHPERDAMPGVRFVSILELFSESDIVSLHAPLSSENEGMVNRELLARMPTRAVLINTGRGGLIHEEDLYEFLQQKRIAAAALDVLREEPPRLDHPLYALENCWITPHMAWASQEARQRLMDITVENVKAYLQGRPVNVVNP